VIDEYYLTYVAPSFQDGGWDRYGGWQKMLEKLKFSQKNSKTQKHFPRIIQVNITLMK
jgi:hypothetical protein